MSRLPPIRAIATAALAVTAAAICVRLGLWQVSRLQERRAHNALLAARMVGAPVPYDALPADTGAGHYRVVTAAGTARYDKDVAWAPRMRRGSPGVNLLTPVRVPGVAGVVMVNRGWVYSPDARSVDFARWRERDSITVAGYVETWAQDCDVARGAAPGAPLPPACGDTATRVLRRLDRAAVERLVGEPVAPYLVMQTSDSALRADSVPARVEAPVLDEGPHFSYAVQWFAFATIALVGGSALARRRASR